MKKVFLGLMVIFSITLIWYYFNKYDGNNNFFQEKETHGSEAASNIKADEYSYLRKADENGNVPFDGLIRAKEHIDRMVPKTRDAGLWEWDWLGPGNIGGRITCILPNPNYPNIIWLGARTGGIWKTIDSGSTWTCLNDFSPGFFVWSLTFDPSSTNIMYAGTNAGIFKSTNGGIGWNQLESTDNNNFASVLKVVSHPHPDSAGIIYAVTSLKGLYDGGGTLIGTAGNKGVWKTKDGGQSWIKVLDPGKSIEDLNIDINNNNEIIVGSRGVYISYDYGNTWIELTTGANNKLPSDGERCEVSFCKSNTNIIYVSMTRNLGEVYRSDDNGLTWSLRSTGTKYLDGMGGNYAHTLWVCPTNSNKIILGGVENYRSVDGGLNLTEISNRILYHNNNSGSSTHADQLFVIEASDYDATTNPEVYFANDGGLQKTNNIWTVTKNSGWVNLANQTLGVTQFYSGAATPDGSIIVGGTLDNDKLRFRSSGNWSGAGNWFQAEVGDGGYSAINYNNSNYIYGSYIGLKIKKSIDGGDSYNYSYTGITDAGDGNKQLGTSPLVMDPNTPSILVAGGANIWVTTNDATSWVKIRNDIGKHPSPSDKYYRCGAIDIAKGNSNIIWIGYENGNLALTTNTGTTWTRVDANGIGLPNRFVTDISINPNNSNEVFVTFGGFSSDNVWYTPDAGVTWEDRSGTGIDSLPALPVNTVRFHPLYEDWVYIGTDLGVFASQDKGQIWSALSHYQGSEGPANIEVSELFWQGNDYLIAATFGRGMYRSSKQLTKIYVDGNASPGGDGSQTSPFQTLAEAVAISWPGSVISIESGIYDESQIITLEKAGFIIKTGSGSVTIE